MKVGRPLVEGERRSVEIKLLVTPTMASKMDTKRGLTKRPDWIRKQIERGLK